MATLPLPSALVAAAVVPHLPKTDWGRKALSIGGEAGATIVHVVGARKPGWRPRPMMRVWDGAGHRAEVTSLGRLAPTRLFPPSFLRRRRCHQPWYVGGRWRRLSPVLSPSRQ